MKYSLLFALVLVVFVQTGALKANQLQSFNDLVFSTKQPYNSAMFYLRTGNIGVAQIELETAKTRWVTVIKRFKGNPPPEFINEKNWQRTLEAITNAFSEALIQAKAGKIKGTRSKLQPIRRILYDLRKRNNIRVFADCIYELAARMDELFVFRKTPPDLEDRQARNAVKIKTTLYRTLLFKCRNSAPISISQTEDFRSLFDGAQQSAAGLNLAIEKRQQTTLINILRELKSFDAFIFLRWG